MPTIKTPNLLRRTVSSLYELALLSGIACTLSFLWFVGFQLTGSQLPIWILQAIIFFAFGFYFTYSWQNSGQTLAQKTWRIKVINTNQQLPNAKQAWLRYIASYVGILPSLLLIYIHTSHNKQENITNNTLFIIIFVALNWISLLGTALMNIKQQALHERLSNTRSILLSSS